MKQRLHVLIEGHVQGVGFRYSTAQKARTLGVTGWVRNLPDGRVEAEFEGEPDALDAMAEWCREGPRSATVRNVEKEQEKTQPEYSEFRIRG